jgi:hypothetical protein
VTVSVPYEFENNTPADATEVNANFAAVTDAFDDYLPLAGGTLSGALVLPNSNPTLDNHAARKKYVDDAVAAVEVGLGAGSVGTTELADDAVTTAKIADDAVTAAQLADASVDLGSAVTTGSLQLSKLENVGYSTFTATLKQGTGTVSSTTGYARWRREGRKISGYAMVTASGSGAATDVISVVTNLPAPLHAGCVCGAGTYLNNGLAYYVLSVEVNSDNFKFFGSDNNMDSARLGESFTVASTDWLKFQFDYEAAS